MKRLTFIDARGEVVQSPLPGAQVLGSRPADEIGSEGTLGLICEATLRLHPTGGHRGGPVHGSQRR